MATVNISFPDSVKLSSSWRTRFFSGDGQSGWGIVSGPYTDTKSVTLGLSAIPAGATINHAELRCYRTGSAVAIALDQVNGYNWGHKDGNYVSEPFTGTVREGFSGSGEVTFTFTFRSVGKKSSPTSQTAYLTYTTDSYLYVDYTPGASNGTLNKGSVPMDGASEITLSISPYNASYSHKAVWACGGASVTHTLDVGVRSTSLIVPKEWNSQVSSGLSAGASCRLETYNGGTKIGEKSLYYTVTVPPDIVPEIDITVEPVDGFDGMYLKAVSRARVTASSLGAYGSTIVSHQFSGGGYSGTETPWTTGALMTAGEQTFVCTVTDSRGRTATVSKRISVTDYHRPVIGSLTAQRSDAQGTPVDSGRYIRLLADYRVADVAGNTVAAAVVKYRKAGDGAWTQAGNAPNGLPGTVFGGNGIDTAFGYEGELHVTDTVGQTAVYNFTVQAETAIFEFLRDRAGIGRVARNEKELILPDDWDLVVRGGKAYSSGHCPFPIDYIYISAGDLSPAEIWPGTVWTMLEEGRFLLSSGGKYGLGGKGGAESVSLTADQNAPHRHPQNVNAYNYAMEESVHLGNGNNGAGSGYYIGQSSYGAVSGPMYTSSAGKGAPIEIMPPYLVVGMWRRTA